jgi:1-acyl-sn-glycerol-3-phosphate acyltransferase
MLKHLDRLWRIFATGFSFATFGAGGLVLSLLVLPPLLLLPVPSAEKRLQVRWLVSRVFRFFFGMMHWLGLVKYRVLDRKFVKHDRGCLVVANHPTLIDVVSLISLYTNACCIVKKDLWNNIFMKKILSSAGYIPNDDPEALLRDCAASLARGDVLIIFPEGTRTVPGREMVLQRGAAHIALRLKCPIRTIQIDVNPSILTKNRPWYHVADRRINFTVKIKERISIEPFLAENLPHSLAARRLTQKVRENIDVGLTNS